MLAALERPTTPKSNRPPPPTFSTPHPTPPARAVDVSGVQRTAAPTRDVYVVRQLNGDREFAGFGLESDAYCDTRVDAARLPLGAIEVGLAVGGWRLGRRWRCVVRCGGCG